MLGEIDHQQAAARRKHARRLGNRRAGLLREMQHLVEDDAVGASIAQRQCVHVALSQAGAFDTGRLELDPGQAQHFRRAVDADGAVRLRSEQLQHPAGAGADVEQVAKRSVEQQAGDRPLNLALGNVQGADAVPGRGMRLEIAASGLGPIGPDRLQPRDVGREQVDRILAAQLS